MSAAATLLLLASSSLSVGTGGVYACSGGSFDVTKFDLKTCDVSVFNKALKKVSNELGISTKEAGDLLGDDTPIDWGSAADAQPPKTEAQIQARVGDPLGDDAQPPKTEAQIQAEKEAAAKEAERQRLLKMPPDTIDIKPGIVKGVEISSDPSWVNASPEDCWSIIKDQPAYGGVVGWGHRNDKHPDPKLKNSCFVYTRNDDGEAMPPFQGDPDDKITISGCHKPGLKLSEGCMTDEEKKYFAKLKRMPPDNVDRVFGIPKGVKIESDPSWSGMSAEDCYKLANDAGIEAGVRAWGYRTSDYKDKKLRNTCFLYRDDVFTKFKGTNDKTVITACVGPGMKVSDGCLTAEEMAQEIQSTSKMQKALAMAAMAAKMAEQLAKQAVEKVARAAKVAAAAVKKAAEETARRVAAAAKAAFNAAKQAAAKAKQAAQYAARKTKEAAEAVANAAKKAAQYAARKTKEAALATARAAKKAAVATANAVKNAAVQSAKQAVAAAKVAAQAAKQAATAVANAAAKAATAAARAAKQAAEYAAKKAAEAAKKAAEAAAAAANAVAKAAKSAVKSVGKALGFCFSPDTPVRLESGELVLMKDIKLGDVLVGGIIVDATMQIKNRTKDVYYKIHSKELNAFIYVTGGHYVKNGDTFVQVCELPDAIPTNEHSEELSCLVTSTHEIPVGEHIFWDWEDNLVPQTK